MRVGRLALRCLVAVAVTAAVLYAGAWATTDRYGASRAIAWLEADTGDIHRFPARDVPAGDTPRPLPTGPPLDLSAALGVADADALLTGTGTTSFLVVQDGALRHEQYLHGSGPDERRTSFSVAKSVVSTLIGLAIEDGSIPSVDEPIVRWLPELAERDPRHAAITVRDLLTMSSGLGYVERSHPWSDDTQTYYGTDLRATALKAQVVEDPGVRFHYNNFNLLLEGLVLERATGQRVSDYLSERLWQPMGAERAASWSIDSHRSGFEKMESGLNAIARDFARFGLLFAEGGVVRDQQVVPAEWVRRATARGPGTGPTDRYAFHWWTGAPDGTPLPDGHVMALGNHGQYVYVAPEEAVVIVRLGDEYGTREWPRHLARIVEYVADSDPPGQ